MVPAAIQCRQDIKEIAANVILSKTLSTLPAVSKANCEVSHYKAKLRAHPHPVYSNKKLIKTIQYLYICSTNTYI